MPKSSTNKPAGRYVVLRPFAEFEAGDIITVDPDDAALLIRDALIAPEPEE